jgi:RNA polymerase sigma-70 factor (ECF subfamily)
MVSKRPFDSEVMPHRAAAYNLAYWLLQDREEAQDVVQDAYLRAFQAYPAFDGQHVKTWLLVIVRKHCVQRAEAEKAKGQTNLAD